jgi:transposase
MTQLRLSYEEVTQRLIRLRNLERLYAEQKVHNQRLTQENKALKAELALTKALVTQQAQTIETLQLQVAELRQIVFGKKKKKKPDDTSDDEGIPSSSPRKTAQRSKDSYHRPIPEESAITTEESHTIDTCIHCNQTLTKKTSFVFYEEDIPVSTKSVIRHSVEKGYCSHCHRYSSSIPLPSTSVILGKQTKILVCYLSIILNLSFEKIRNLLSDTYHLAISDGEISCILEKEANTLRSEYERLTEKIRSQTAVHYDETSWRVQQEAQGHFGWVMTGATGTDTVFDLGKSRGKGNAEKLKGDGEHIGISDDYGAYRTLFTIHQLCWAHPLRKFRDLKDSPSLSEEKKILCQKMYEEFARLYQSTQTFLTEEHSQKERGQKRAVVLRQLWRISESKNSDPQKLQTLKTTLRKNRSAYVTCLTYPDIPMDNNKAERSLRHLVLKRKTSLGSKTQRGAETTSILASVMLSLWWRKTGNFFEAYREMRGV